MSQRSDAGLSRRRFLRNAGFAGLGVVGAGPLLNACATSASSGPVTQTGGAVTVQSNLSAPAAKSASDALVAAFNDRGGASASVDTVASGTFRTQLPSYLTSANPPDTYTWYPGSLLSGYAEKGLLLDVGDVWQMFYRKSKFAEWGVTPPTNWTEFLTLCRTLQGRGIAPIGLGAGGNTPWIASGWFDYLDIRINGARFHRDLLAGRKRFDDPKVKQVFATWKEALPYFDPSGTAVAFQDATTSLLQGRTGMLLIGAFFADSAPKDALGDIDFFQFPIIDPAVPGAEEGRRTGSSPAPGLRARAEVAEFLRFAATAEGQDAGRRTGRHAHFAAGGTRLQRRRSRPRVARLRTEDHPATHSARALQLMGGDGFRRRRGEPARAREGRRGRRCRAVRGRRRLVHGPPRRHRRSRRLDARRVRVPRRVRHVRRRRPCARPGLRAVGGTRVGEPGVAALRRAPRPGVPGRRPPAHADPRDEARDLVARYKEIRDIVHTGEVHRLPDAVQYVTPATTVVPAWRTGALPGIPEVPGRPVRPPLRGLSTGSYVDRESGAGYSAAHLTHVGLPVHWTRDHDADVVVLDHVAT